MSSDAPAIPLFGDAYMADTMHLTLEEHGAYLRLLMLAWRLPNCSLPNDDARLARMLGISGQRWRKLKPVVMAFWVLEEGMWTQKRLKKERLFVAQKSKKNSENAKARWAQDTENKQSDECERISERICQTDAPPPPPTYIPSSNEEGRSASNSDAQFWANAKAYLGGKNPGALIGKWCRTYTKAEVAKAIGAAQVERAVDPIPYIERILRGAGKKAAMPVC